MSVWRAPAELKIGVDLSSLVVDLTYQEGIQRDILEYER